MAAIISTREICDWDVVEETRDRLALRPGPAATSSALGYGALAAVLSFVFYLMGVRGGWGWLLHLALWLIAVVWPFSMLWQRISFTHAGDKVIVEGITALRPYRKDFPVGATSLQLSMTRHTERRGRVSVHVGFNWTILIHGGNTIESMRVAYTMGTNPPGHIPPDAKKIVQALQNLLETVVVDQSMGGTRGG